MYFSFFLGGGWGRGSKVGTLKWDFMVLTLNASSALLWPGMYNDECDNKLNLCHVTE